MRTAIAPFGSRWDSRSAQRQLFDVRIMPPQFLLRISCFGVADSSPPEIHRQVVELAARPRPAAYSPTGPPFVFSKKKAGSGAGKTNSTRTDGRRIAAIDAYRCDDADYLISSGSMTCGAAVADWLRETRKIKWAWSTYHVPPVPATCWPCAQGQEGVAVLERTDSRCEDCR